MQHDDGQDETVRGADAPEAHPTPQDPALPAAPDRRRARGRDERRVASERRRLDRAEGKAARRAARQSRGPGVWRTVVWPVLRLVVFAVIAAALVKLAFFPDAQTTAASGEVPTASMQEPMVAATLGTVRNDLTLTGQVLPDDAVTVRSTQTGTVARVTAEDGQGVTEGQELYVVRVETAATEPVEDGSMPEPTVQYFSILSPTAGVLTGFEVLLNQDMQIGTETGAVQPGSFHVDAALSAAQQYRLTTQPEEAQVQIPGGPAPFTCTNLTVLQPSAAGGAQGEEGTGTVSTATMRCDVPANVRVFSGLAADVTVQGGVAEDVVTLPTTAVLGSSDDGVVVRLAADGSQEEVPVELGLTDGTQIEIRGGLAEGDEVMEFVPGGEPADPCADPATADPMVCGEVVP